MSHCDLHDKSDAAIKTLEQLVPFYKKHMGG